MNNFEKLAVAPPLLDQADLDDMAAVCASVPGYSNIRHYAFFRNVFSCTEALTVLVLGVYFGRDISFMARAGCRSRRSLTIIGVDKFSDSACADWIESAKNSTWEEAGFGPAPNLKAATRNIAPFKEPTSVILIQQDDGEYLADCRQKFDFIYIDTAHDYETVRRQLSQSLPLLAEDGILAGDDYSDQGTWGVQKALKEVAPGHLVFADWIWFASRSSFR